MNGSWRVQRKYKVVWMWQPTSGRFLYRTEAQRKLNWLQADDPLAMSEFRIIHDTRPATHRFGPHNTRPVAR